MFDRLRDLGVPGGRSCLVSLTRPDGSEELVDLERCEKFEVGPTGPAASGATTVYYLMRDGRCIKKSHQWGGGDFVHEVHVFVDARESSWALFHRSEHAVGSGTSGDDLQSRFEAYLEKLPESERDTLKTAVEVLQASPKPLTQHELMDTLLFSDSVLRRVLAAARKHGFVVNSKKAPKGYRALVRV
jgi:hypothetical protein